MVRDPAAGHARRTSDPPALDTRISELRETAGPQQGTHAAPAPALSTPRVSAHVLLARLCVAGAVLVPLCRGEDRGHPAGHTAPGSELGGSGTGSTRCTAGLWPPLSLCVGTNPCSYEGWEGHSGECPTCAQEAGQEAAPQGSCLDAERCPGPSGSTPLAQGQPAWVTLVVRIPNRLKVVVFFN